MALPDDEDLENAELTALHRPVTGEVGDESMVLSRLAAATFGEPGAVPAGWSVHRVTPRGDGG